MLQHQYANFGAKYQLPTAMDRYALPPEFIQRNKSISYLAAHIKLGVALGIK